MDPTPASASLNAFDNFGDFLKYLRRRQKLTQLELSINVGYSEAQISRLEKNLRLPDLAALKALFIPALHLEDEPELTARYLELAQSARQEDAPSPGLAPYKGLLFFDETDAELFFGREALTARLVEHVMDLTMDGMFRFLAVVGASGSGKSSLVRAGLAFTLRRAGWDVRTFTPTANPLKIVEANLNAARTKSEERGLIVVDQFEEVFTLCHDEMERIGFFEKLIACSQDKSKRITVVIALRADFYAHCAQYPLLRQAVAAEQEYIGQMSRDELCRAIEQPAKRGGWEFEPGVIDVLLRDLNVHGSHEPEPGALPLLSHALLSTWEHRRGRTFTLDGYHASGGIRGAIAETAESVFTDQLNQSQQEIARDVFLRLTELGEGTEDTRRRAALNELVRQSAEAAQLRTVLNTLAEARLITLNEDSAEVAHEALIREWQRLHEWLTENREGLLLHRHLTESAHEWETRGREPSELYRGARLAQARDWASTLYDEMNQLEHEFLQASIRFSELEASEREAQRQRELEAAQKLADTQSRAAKQLRWRATFLAGAFILAVALAGVALFFVRQANQNALQAQQNAAWAQSRELASAAISNLVDDPERSILLALHAVSTAHTREAENALHRSILESRVLLVLRHDAEVWSVIYSPDGKRIGTASQDKTAKIWDASTGQLLLTLLGHTGSVNGIVYSPDGKRIATTSDDRTAKIWDATTGEELLTLSGHTDRIFRIAFSPDGSSLATASQDKTVKVWETLTGKEVLTIPHHGEIVYDVVFSPDGKRLVTTGNVWTSSDGNIRVWDAGSGMEMLTLPMEGGGPLRGIAFSSDGTRLGVTSITFPGGKVWDAATGEVLLDGFPDHQGGLFDIAFSPDGKLLATGSVDTKAKVWDAVTGQVLYTLSGHRLPVNGVALSPDSTRLATSSWDYTARVWDLTPAKELLFIPVSPPWSQSIGYSPDGTRITTEDRRENAVKTWDAISGKERLSLSGPTGQILGALPSPDGNMVAAGYADKKIIVWDAQAGRQVVTLTGHTAGLSTGCFSPDGTRFASGSVNGEIIIWDVASGTAVFMLQGPTPSSAPNIVEYSITSLAFSPDGNRVLSSDISGQGIIWDVTTGNKLLVLSTKDEDPGNADIPKPILSVAYSPDGKSVALASDRSTARILNASTGTELLTLKGHTGAVLSVTFSPDGKRVATSSADGTRLWDATTGVNLLMLPVSGSLSFRPDGKHLAVGSETGVHVFVVPIEDLVALAKSRVTRSLTTEECQQYLHVEQCPAQP